MGMGTAQGRASTNPVRMLRTVVLPAGTDRHEKQHRDRVFDVRNRSIQKDAKRTERRATYRELQLFFCVTQRGQMSNYVQRT